MDAMTTTPPITTVSGRNVSVQPRTGTYAHGATIQAGSKTVLTLSAQSLLSLRDELIEVTRGRPSGITAEDRIQSIAAHAGLEVTIHPRYPVWQAGDVVVLRFRFGQPEYTYVRAAAGSWPGQQRSLTDKQVNDLWRAGLVRHVLRNGSPVSA